MPQTRNEIIRNLPYLRRYARALVGSQELGDQYVRICLETLVEEPERFQGRFAVRFHLYRLFHEVWGGLTNGYDDDGTVTPLSHRRFQQHLIDLPPFRRQILLLTALEGFSIEETARILGIPDRVAVAELALARAELNEQAMTSVLVIEDEPIIAFDIVGIVTDMGHDVVGIATNREDAVSMARKKRPGIILADIQLDDDGSGIDAVADIRRSQNTPVVFVTAYPERLLTGQRGEPAFLVTKPFEPDILKVTIYQAMLSGGPSERAHAMANG